MEIPTIEMVLHPHTAINMTLKAGEYIFAPNEVTPVPVYDLRLRETFKKKSFYFYCVNIGVKTPSNSLKADSMGITRSEALKLDKNGQKDTWKLKRKVFAIRSLLSGSYERSERPNVHTFPCDVKIFLSVFLQKDKQKD